MIFLYATLKHFKSLLKEKKEKNKSISQVTFFCNHFIFRRGGRTSSILGSMLPESVNEVLDPADHHVLHNAFPAGVKRSVG